MTTIRLRFGILFLFLIGFLLLALAVEPTAASAPTLQLIAPVGPQSTLATVDVDIRISQAANLGACGI